MEPVDDNVGALVTVVVGAVVLVPAPVAESVTVDRFGAVMDIDPAVVDDVWVFVFVFAFALVV